MFRGLFTLAGSAAGLRVSPLPAAATTSMIFCRRLSESYSRFLAMIPAR